MKKCWGIRHIRFIYHFICFQAWIRYWQNAGFLFPQDSDLEYLRGIWDGKN